MTRDAPLAVIESAEITGGHDGEAELVVTLRFTNGGRTAVVLDTQAGMRLMRNCGVDHAAALIGQPWNRILEQDSCSI
ncbi:MAG: hypothetical protein HC809_14385 [Gammaproteobacteria bacterium]|nr:hypothetical protein [Gammaproteobacteria bacterium]